jgi:glycosyltransferase involved in cell wall biosynthesis
MSRKRLVISSKTEGGKEIIQDDCNGLLFNIGDENQLAEKIFFALDVKNKNRIEQLKENAFKSSEQFKWSELIKKIEMIF